MTLGTRTLTWMTDPDGGGCYPKQRDAIAAHDPTCLSLPHAWHPRRAGVSCDIGGCDDCPVIFHTDEGAVFYGVYPEPEIVDEHGDVRYLCECCSRKYRA